MGTGILSSPAKWGLRKRSLFFRNELSTSQVIWTARKFPKGWECLLGAVRWGGLPPHILCRGPPFPMIDVTGSASVVKALNLESGDVGV